MRFSANSISMFIDMFNSDIFACRHANISLLNWSTDCVASEDERSCVCSTFNLHLALIVSIGVILDL